MTDYHAALKRLAGKHPRVLVRPERLAELRADFARKYPLMLGRLKRARREFDADLMPEPPATKTKTQFVQTMDRIRRFCGRMERFAQAYLVTGDRQYADQAKRILLHIARWDVNAGGGFRACDEVPMSIMQLGPRTYDWIHDALTDAERETIRRCLRERGRLMFNRVGRGKTVPRDSHGGRMLGFLGEAGIAFYGEFPEARQWLDAMVSLIAGPYPQWGSDDGGWAEGPGYWSWYMAYMIPFLDAFYTATGSDALLKKPFFRNTIYYGIYCTPLTLPVAPFGDAAERNSAYAKAPNARFFGSVYNEGYFIWYSQQYKSSVRFHEVLRELGGRAGEPVAPKPPGDLPQSRLFDHIGWVAMHSDLANSKNDVFLMVKSSPYGGRSHSHADQNAFVLSACDQPLAIASGYYDYYGSPHHYGWTRRTKANNAILVDGEGQHPRKGSAQIEAFVTDGAGGGISYARGSAKGVYDGRLTRALRHVLKLDAATYLLIDDLAAPQPATFSWLVHSLNKMQLAPTKSALTLSRGEAVCRIQLACDAGLALSQTDQFDPPPLRKQTIKTRGKPSRPDHWHARADTKQERAECAIVARLAVAKKGQQGEPFANERFIDEPGCVAASWQRGEERVTVLVRKAKPGGAAPKLDGVELSGKVGAVVLRDGKLDRYVLVEGKGLVRGGGSLVDAAEAVSVCLARVDGGVRIGLGPGSGGSVIRLKLPPGVPRRKAKFRRRGERGWQPIELSRERGLVVVKHPGAGGEIAF